MSSALDYINTYIHHNIPLTGFMQLSVTKFSQEGLIIRAPLLPNINDKGTAFGGSLAAMLTLAGWALTVLVLREAGITADVMVYQSSTDYRKPVTGELIIRCEMPCEEDRQKFISDFRADNKAKWKLEVCALDEAGEKAVIYTGKYYGKN